jgi:hypothetical protein
LWFQEFRLSPPDEHPFRWRGSLSPFLPVHLHSFLTWLLNLPPLCFSFHLVLCPTLSLSGNSLFLWVTMHCAQACTLCISLSCLVPCFTLFSTCDSI